MRSRVIFTTVFILASAAAVVSPQEHPVSDSLQAARPSASETWLSFARPMPLMIPWLEPTQGFETALPSLLVPLSLAPHPLLTPHDPILKPDLTAPLRLQRAREESNRTLYAVLGTVHLGGVAYLAYRHIKKYGF
jgi:hypothetical protein